MRVSVESDLYRVVAELLGNVQDVVSLGDSQRCVGVPKVVNPDSSKACLLQALVENPPPQMVQVDPVADFVVKKVLRRTLPSLFTIDWKVFRWVDGSIPVIFCYSARNWG